jgi:hypothetical protein
MGPPSYMRSVVDRKVVMRRMSVLLYVFDGLFLTVKNQFVLHNI